MQVFELQHDRAAVARHRPGGTLRRGVKGAIANLFRVVQDASEVTARRPFDADQVAQHVGVAFGDIRSVLREEQRDDARFHLLTCDVDAFVVGDLETPCQDVTQETEGWCWVCGVARPRRRWKLSAACVHASNSRSNRLLPMPASATTVTMASLLRWLRRTGA